MTFAEFFHMGGYAFYVWSSYGLALVVMAFVIVKPIMDKKAIIRNLSMKYRREENK